MNDSTNPVTPQPVSTPSPSAPVASEPMTKPNLTLVKGGKKHKILVVEDEQDARTIFKSLLESNADYTVLEAVDGVEALEVLGANPDVELILLDIIMPRMDGIEALKQVKANPTKFGSPVVVMLTNVGGDIAIDNAKQNNADGYLLKIDLEPEEMLKSVGEYLSKYKKGQDAKASQLPPMPADKPAAELPKAA